MGSHCRHNVPPPRSIRLGDVCVHLLLDSNSPFLRDLPPAASAEVLRDPLVPCGTYLRESEGGPQVGNILGRCSERTRASGFPGLMEQSPLHFAQRHCFVLPLSCLGNFQNREPCIDPESYSHRITAAVMVSTRNLSAPPGAHLMRS